MSLDGGWDVKGRKKAESGSEKRRRSSCACSLGLSAKLSMDKRTRAGEKEDSLGRYRLRLQSDQLKASFGF